MNFMGSLFAALTISVLASVSGIFATSAPSASFSASTANPAAGSLVQFTDTSTDGPGSWAWDFGDGGTSAERNPSHVYAASGSFTARLTASNTSGPASATLAVTVTDSGVLRLNGAHSFDLTLTARDPRTGNTGSGKVIGQNDVYGYFSLPSLSGNAGNPEIIVKMVDATGAPALGGGFWFFHAALTDVQYTMTVMDQTTGAVRTYTNASSGPGQLCGGVDTSAFPGP